MESLFLPVRDRATRALMLCAATCVLHACLYPEYVETDSLNKKPPSTDVGAGSTQQTPSSSAPRGGSAAETSADGPGGYLGSTFAGGGGNAGGLPAAQGGSSAATQASGGLTGGSINSTTFASSNGGSGGGSASRPSSEMGGVRVGAGTAGTVLASTTGAFAGSSAIAAICGNQKREGNETCDDGNQIDGDGCSADCRSTEICGNGITDGAKSEECDLGTCPASTSTPGTCNHDSGTCTSNCKVARCGDGKVRTIVGSDGSAPEQCDLGAANVAPAKAYGAGVCTTTCLAAPQCGDGKVDQAFGEVCDDNNTANGDGCSAACKNGQNRPCASTTDCAEGLLCDLSPGQNRCEKERTCGNGKLDKADREACDDGNTADADGCSSACLIEVGAATECGSSSQCAAGSCLLPTGGTATRRCLIANGEGPCTANDQCEGGLCAADKCALGTK
ncbi:MAG TPA: DUF4215 domain-containing protein [Polyangiaceae bacterium]|nr:DUF4215 domain-containing protein [Polyangiaceae bacterium]